ncbi:MAG: DNA polymerase III subunit delta' [Neisseria sp.]|nr:DNA polymerase III subunit delta' [Neisseria sp.]
MIYPWHQSAWQQLSTCGDRLPNAWLLYGQRDIGKLAFARELARVLLCEQPPHAFAACGECASCHLSAQGTHPDCYELTPLIEDEDNAKKLLHIKIEAVREVIDNIHLTPLRAPRRVVLIHPAESMNVQAANALLKVLEEPSPSVIFLLVTHNRDRLLPTIKSRCRQFLLPTPTHGEALAYLHAQKIPNAEAMLAFHGGSPLFSVDEKNQHLRHELMPVLVVPKLLAILDYAALFDKEKQPLAVFLDWFDKWLIDIIATAQGGTPVFYPDHADDLTELADKLPLLPLIALRDRVTELVPFGQHTLNVKLALESLLIDYLKLTL